MIKRFQKESKHLHWLPFNQIAKETLIVLIVSILFTLAFGGINTLLQQSFNYLLEIR